MSLPRADEWTDPGSIDPPQRPGRRAALLFALTVAALLGSALAWRFTSLRGLPDIPPPFDLERYGTVAIPDGENAFTYYRQAVAEMVPHRWPNDPMTGAWSQKPQHDRDWFFANAPALELWFEGTTKERSVYNQPKDVRIEDHLNVAQELRSLNRLALIAAQRMEAIGEPEEAWPWYRAALGATRHCGTNGSFIERLIGIAMYTKAAGLILAWSDHPNLGREAVRKALDQVIAINATTPTFAENLRVEYFLFSKLLDDPDATVGPILKAMGGHDNDPAPTFAQRANEHLMKLVRREPERSRRALKLLWANWLSVGDLSVSERRKRRREYPVGLLFDPPPDAPASARLLSPDDLNRWTESTRLIRHFLPAIDALEGVQAREAALRASLVVGLAEELYSRDHGNRPDSPDQLVGPYLKALPDGYKRDPTK